MKKTAVSSARARALLKILLVALILAGAVALRATGLSSVLTLANLKAHYAELLETYRTHPIETISIYLGVYVLSTALSFPGATVLTLAGGAIFGFWTGTLIVSFASTIGSTFAFLMTRFVLRDWVKNRFSDRVAKVDEGIRKEGSFYLLTLRLVPIFPFFLVNLLMGLTAMRTTTFFIVSQIGMLPGTAAYINAGQALSQITSLKGVLSFGTLLSFTILGILPLVSKAVVNSYRARKLLRKFSRPRRFDYNLVVIGAGSAGLVSAYIASAIKAKVALIEKHKMGGDCLNTGCVPSKTFIRSAKILSYIRRAQEFGLKPLTPDFDFARVMDRVRRVISKVEPHDSVERYTKLGVDCIEGAARIVSPFEVEVSGKRLTARNIIVATGARPLVPTISGLDQIKYLTSDNVWDIKSFPKRLLVLGGGPIGCELAQAFSRFGSQVSVVEMAPRLLVREDADVSAFVADKFEREGIQVFTNHKARAFITGDATRTLICESNGKEVRVEFDEVLLALGRKANVTGLGLEELGVEVAKSGTIEHDEFMRTNYPNIYVCGDVAGPYQFTHTAAHQAWYASVNALFSPFKKFKADYRVIPWCTFTDPEVARVGLNEQDAKEKGIEVQVTKYELDDLDRAIAEEEDHGFVKVLTPSGKDTILGATIVGSHAGDIIAEYVAAMKHGFGLNKILGTIHIYPTLAEANKYAAGNWKKATAPKRALEFIEKFHAWRRGQEPESPSGRGPVAEQDAERRRKT